MYPVGKKKSEESKKKLSDWLKNAWKSGVYKGSTGIKHSKEARRKMSLVHKGKKRPQFSKEWRQKIGNANRGKIRSIETRQKIGLSKIGEKNRKWKGNNVGYNALHDWVKRRLGYPIKCENCKKDGLKNCQIHWANKSREYKRELTDWLRLCAKCHKAYDTNRLILK